MADLAAQDPGIAAQWASQYTPSGGIKTPVPLATTAPPPSGIVAGVQPADTEQKPGGIVAGGPSTAPGTTVPWKVTQDQTVEGRINGILNNSPIIQQARTHALQQMNERGTMNSSMATTASDAAAYQAAIPIAQADAATASKAAGYNADIQNQFNTNSMNRSASMDQAVLGANTQKSIATMNAETQRTVAGLNIEAQAQSQKLQLANATLLQTNSQASQVYGTAMNALSVIANNDKMDPAAKTHASANVWRSVQMQLDVLSSVSGLKLGDHLSFANYAGFDAKGNWVGLPDPPPKNPDDVVVRPKSDYQA